MCQIRSAALQRAQINEINQSVVRVSGTLENRASRIGGNFQLTFFKNLLQHSSFDQLVSALSHGHLPLQS